MIKIAICDDEPYMRDALAFAISDYAKNAEPLTFAISSFTNGSALLTSGGNYDIIFLDIQMENPDGMETAEKLRKSGYSGLLIFITVLKEYVFDAFEVQAFDYLVKPLEKKRFQRTMDRAVKSIQQDTERSLLIQKGNSCMVIPLSQIVYCEIIGRKIYLHLADSQINDYYEKLDKLEAKVDGRFFRCHRSYLVNLDFVRGCSDRQVLLPLCDKIPVSRLREQELLQALLRRMKS